ncbi:MAG TPA: uroporphyrinogen decarboxylase family protein [Chthonomonadales bacterium]|nr:uroporphyrinogen decarboxylase family protein [Chthonomonadales bacterium]
MTDALLSLPVQPDADAFLRCIRREGTPDRVHAIELFLDGEVQQVICDRYDLLAGIDPSDPWFWQKREMRLQRHLGYDYVRCGVEGLQWPLNWGATEDTAAVQRAGGRRYVNEHRGPITSWEEFERYPWPDPTRGSHRSLEWFEANLPEGMCVIGGGGFAHFAEYLVWLMGYETLCVALYEQRDLVQAISDRLLAIFDPLARQIVSYPRVRALWGSDDMGFRTGPLIKPDDLRQFVLPGHRRMAEIARAAGRPYLLHSCGNLSTIMGDLLDDVRIDAKHSFEDTIESVIEAKATYGRRIALLGGIDVDFLCVAQEGAIRERVRRTLDTCMFGGGYCLGTGNSVANYVPVESYLAMLDEGRRYAA